MKTKKTGLLASTILLSLTLFACNGTEDNPSSKSNIEIEKATTSEEIEKAHKLVPFELSSIFSDQEIDFIPKDKKDELKPILEYIYNTDSISTLKSELKEKTKDLDEKSKEIVYLALINKMENNLYSNPILTGEFNATEILLAVAQENGSLTEEQIKSTDNEDFLKLYKEAVDDYLFIFLKDQQVLIELDSNRIKKDFEGQLPTSVVNYLDTINYTVSMELFNPDQSINFNTLLSSYEYFKKEAEDKNFMFSYRYEGMAESYLLYLLGFGTLYNPYEALTEHDYSAVKQTYSKIKNSNSELKEVMLPLIENLENNNYILKGEGLEIIKNVSKQLISEERYNQTFGSIQ